MPQYTKFARTGSRKIWTWKCIGHEFSEEKLVHSMRDGESGMYWTMHKAYDIVYDMCFNELADTLTIIPDISIWSIYYRMRDAMNKVHYDAAFTFQKCVKESENYDTANLQSILAATMKKMVHDCKLASKAKPTTRSHKQPRQSKVQVDVNTVYFCVVKKH